MSKDQVTPVNDIIAHDDRKLEEKASQLYGADIVLDSKETTGTDFEILDASICAVLVRKGGGAGAVRVHSNPVKNVVTGPTQGPGYVIVIVKSGEDCMLLGNPSVRYFRRRSP
ncbi:MAG: hypothetical protein Q9163_005001 [Psora crenata]